MLSRRLPGGDEKASAETQKQADNSVFPSVGKAQSCSRFWMVFVRFRTCGMKFVPAEDLLGPQKEAEPAAGVWSMWFRWPLNMSEVLWLLCSVHEFVLM